MACVSADPVAAGRHCWCFTTQLSSLFMVPSRPPATGHHGRGEKWQKQCGDWSGNSLPCSFILYSNVHTELHYSSPASLFNVPRVFCYFPCLFLPNPSKDVTRRDTSHLRPSGFFLGGGSFFIMRNFNFFFFFLLFFPTLPPRATLHRQDITM